MARIAGNTKKIWLGASETYPVIACSVLAVGWTTYMSYRFLFKSPDTLSFDRSVRSTPLKDTESRAEAWAEFGKRHLPKDPSQISIIRSYERKYD